jgi:glycosyltransferase involved in cell wall biosynthesis
VRPFDRSGFRAERGKEKLKIGRNGILVPVKDVNALVAAMEFFIDHPEQIATMGRESRVYAQERYDVHKVNDEILRAMGIGG